MISAKPISVVSILNGYTDDGKTEKRTKMKYLTLDWWMGNSEEESVLDKYHEDFENVKKQLSKSILEFADSVDLHDGNIFRTYLRSGEIRLYISCFIYDEKGVGVGRSYYEVIYGGVEEAKFISDPEKGLPGPFGFGDMGYDEWEIKENGKFCHSILCSSGIEIKIIFESFAWNKIDEHSLLSDQV